jgi:hypothetical protein
MYQTINIYQDKILYDSVKYVCRQLRLELVQYIQDHVGKKAAILKDTQGRRYFFACKRYIYFQKEQPGIISFTKSLVKMAWDRHCILLMLIEDKDGDAKRNYIYMFNPAEIMGAPESWSNIFNEQAMLNFPVWYAINVEPTRRRELLVLRTEFYKKKEHAKPGKQKDKMMITLRRFV